MQFIYGLFTILIYNLSVVDFGKFLSNLGLDEYSQLIRCVRVGCFINHFALLEIIQSRCRSARSYKNKIMHQVRFIITPQNTIVYLLCLLQTNYTGQFYLRMLFHFVYLHYVASVERFSHIFFIVWY